MSLEDAVQRLANAVGMHDDTAVREIIKQRDDWQKSYNTMKNDRDYQKERADRHFNNLQTANHRIASLQGVITRMKRKAVK